MPQLPGVTSRESKRGFYDLSNCELILCNVVVPEAKNESSRGPLKGAMSAQRAFQDRFTDFYIIGCYRPPCHIDRSMKLQTDNLHNFRNHKLFFFFLSDNLRIDL